MQWAEIHVTVITHLLFGAFAQLQKATFSFVMSVRPFVCLSARNSLVPTAWIFFKSDV
jgi:hypothetical protein